MRHLTLCRSLGLTAYTVLAIGACGDDDAVGDGGIAPDGGHPDYYACEVPSDCLVVPESCCGTCGAPTRSDAVAVARDKSAAFQAAACGSDTGCPACAPLFIDPTLVASCRARRCELIDLLEHEASACESDDNCHVRTPDCCPCGGDTSPGRLIGVSSENAYSALVCDPESACPECGPIYPDEVTVSCNADDHCVTHDTRVDPGLDSGVPDGGDIDAGRPSFCSLPPESGPCDAAIQRYYYDAASGRCALFIWGGCDGNDNNFATAQECGEACDASEPPLAGCEVEGVLYPSGSSDIGDPVSCNTCSCDDGMLTLCTEIGCPEECPAGTSYGVDCARCGPVDNCEIVRTDCLQACETPEDCAEGGDCVDDVCLSRCG
jgi:hypothetical protein